jgi:hypothetical protein
MTWKISLLAAAAMLAAACSKNEPAGPSAPSQVVVSVAQSDVASGVRVSLIRVENESRCPSTVTCVWQGDATAVITVQVGSSDGVSGLLAQQFVHTSVEPRSVVVSGYRVRLDSLTPYPTGQPIEQKDYRGYFTVTRVQ